MSGNTTQKTDESEGEAPAIDWERRATSAENSLAKIAKGLRDRGHVTGDADFDIAGTTLAKLDEIDGANAQLKRQISAHKGQATRARAEAVEAREKGKPRKLGAPPEPKKGEEPVPELTAAELLELIEDADDVQVVASDGRHEIPGVPAFSIGTGGLVEKRAGQLMLNVESLRVTGPNVGAPASIAGFALVLDGEQVAWAPLSDAIPLGAGQQYELKDSVVFGVAETV